MSERSLRNGESRGLLCLAKVLPGLSGSLALEGMQERSRWRQPVPYYLRPESKMELPVKWVLGLGLRRITPLL